MWLVHIITAHNHFQNTIIIMYTRSHNHEWIKPFAEAQTITVKRKLRLPKIYTFSQSSHQTKQFSQPNNMHGVHDLSVEQRTQKEISNLLKMKYNLFVDLASGANGICDEYSIRWKQYNTIKNRRQKRAENGSIWLIQILVMRFSSRFSCTNFGFAQLKALSSFQLNLFPIWWMTFLFTNADFCSFFRRPYRNH